MVDELVLALQIYEDRWDKLAASRKDRGFFDSLQATAVGWKVTDLQSFEESLAAIRDQCDQIHRGWVNQRWLATLHLKDRTLPMGLSVIKLMQRRPGSTDAIGLDHVDFHFKDGDARSVVIAETDLKWTEERNGEHCKWISIWFEDTEAKLRADTVLDVCAGELLDLKPHILH